ncbi:MAG: hypothetical protein ACR2PA_06005 [Hyphomicrobiaceae bacterium]
MLAGLFAMACTANAEDVQIGNASVTLTHPSEFCPLDSDQPADSRVVTFVQGLLAGRNRLLKVYALCNELPKWRSGKTPLLTDMLQFQTVIRMMSRDLSRPYPRFRKRICDEFRSQGQVILKKIAPESDKRLAALSEKIKLNRQRLVGVLDGLGERCYALLLQKIRTETGTTFTQLAVFAPVLVKGKFVFTYLFTPFEESIGSQPAVRRLRAIEAALERANVN